jgi:hypothetical protein
MVLPLASAADDPKKELKFNGVFRWSPDEKTGKIALAHLNEFPDYYTRLERMEEEAKRDWAAT